MVSTETLTSAKLLTSLNRTLLTTAIAMRTLLSSALAMRTLLSTAMAMYSVYLLLLAMLKKLELAMLL